ncbi:hypothetical protein SAMN04489724_3347 [Algoriphagus locisalis]|uniref:Uncharacterized protein n=1 Tax=Algoriphagus locisalis TaxID=305507 RepID=A0A1I7CR30_9BACT|nr:hypothetical protein [Algoriphagus locisalis]SFU01917.1 hypothetical protein SAMN04489724_3347 [Algoriphagus locisalis]
MLSSENYKVMEEGRREMGDGRQETEDRRQETEEGRRKTEVRVEEVFYLELPSYCSGRFIK